MKWPIELKSVTFGLSFGGSAVPVSEGLRCDEGCSGFLESEGLVDMVAR
jgi:hypothetical protein